MMFPVLKHFSSGEFNHPELMLVPFLYWLDLVRDRAKVAMVITDDARLAGDVPSGGSATSLHYRGRAVDVRSRNWSSSDKWRVAEAVMFYSNQAPGKIELELVYDADGDKHWHIGVDELAKSHQLLESDD